MDDLRTRPANLSDAQADRWDAWEASCHPKSDVPSPAEIDHLSMLARTDPVAMPFTRPQFLQFLAKNQGKTLTTRQMADMCGCKLNFARTTVSALMRGGSPLLRRIDGRGFEILPSVLSTSDNATIPGTG